MQRGENDTIRCGPGSVNDYLVARYGDPCRECGFVWTLDLRTARDLVEGADARLAVLRDFPATTPVLPRGTWGAAGYVAHLADSVRIWAGRLAATSLDPAAAIVTYEEGALGAIMGYASASIEGSLWTLTRAIGDWKAARSLAGCGVHLDHPEQGLLTVDEVQAILAHEVHHHSKDLWRASIGAGSFRSDFSLAREDPDAPDAAELVQAHLLFNRAVTPQGHVHALETDALTGPAVDFFGVRTAGGRLVAIGAFKWLSVDHGELKSMHTHPLWRGRGAGAAMVRHLLDHAATRGCARVSLETGSVPAFEPARRLYTRLGFTRCAPFADYTDNPHSVCMTRTVWPTG